MNKIRNYWESAKPNMLALGNPNDEQIKFIEEFWFSDINLTDATIIDYGCGSGFFGDFLLKNYKIEKFIGIDISKKALAATEAKLDDKSNYDLKLTPVNLSTLNAKVLLSHSTIRFFTKEMVDEFLTNVNNSEIPYILLNWRNGDSVEFNRKLEFPNINTSIMMHANFLTIEFLKENLSEYELTDISGNYAIFTLKEYVEHPDLIPGNEFQPVEIPEIEIPVETIKVDIEPSIFEILPEHVSETEEAIEDLHIAGETKTGKTLFWYHNGTRLIKALSKTAEKKGYRPATKSEII